MATAAQTDLATVVQESSAELVKHAAALEPLLGKERQDIRITGQMALGGFAPDGVFRHAPAEAVTQAFEAFKAEDDRKLGRMLADLDDDIRIMERCLPGAEEGLQEPPSVEAVIRARLGNIEQSPSAYLNAMLLDVTLEAVLAPKVAAATVAEAHRLYMSALSDPLVPRQAMTITLIEAKVQSGTFSGSADPEAADLLADLARTVQQHRQGRIPKEIKVWRSTVATGRRTLLLAKAAHVKPAQSVEQQHLLALMQAVK